MKKFQKGKGAAVFLTVGMLLLAACTAGCSGEDGTEDKVEDLEFTVVGSGDLPQELKDIIEQKKKEAFRLTYTSGEDLYIAAGYGEQKTGGYSILVPELYLTENSITIRTELQGPEKSEQTGTEPTWPYVVVKTEFLDQPVVFK